jgi:D-lyxose ketol-isomerase
MAAPAAGANTQTPSTPGTAITAIPANQAGGYIVNPLAAVDQGLPQGEVLYVDQVGGAKTQANGTTLALQPGQSYTVIPFTLTPVTVASNSASHKFTAVCWPTA